MATIDLLRSDSLQLKQAQSYRVIGAQLAAYLRQRSDAAPSAARLQALVADLAASHAELTVPLKELVSRPGFQALVPRAGSASGALQRDALLQELSSTFASPVVAALAELLNGFLDLPAEAAEQTPPSTTVEPPAPAASAPAPQPPPTRPLRSRWLVLLSVITALLGAGAVAMLQHPSVCRPLGLCGTSEPEPSPEPPAVSTASEQALSAARRAEQALRRATTLGAYQAALSQLEQELLKLSGDPLTSEQQGRREQLQQAATEARQVLAGEERDQQRLQRATEALTAARQGSGEEQAAQIRSAQQELDAIPPRSFSFSEASRLREELEVLIRQPTTPPEPQQQPVAPGGALPESPASRRSPVAPPPPSQSNSAPYRSEPLF